MEIVWKKLDFSCHPSKLSPRHFYGCNNFRTQRLIPTRRCVFVCVFGLKRKHKRHTKTTATRSVSTFSTTTTQLAQNLLRTVVVPAVGSDHQTHPATTSKLPHRCCAFPTVNRSHVLQQHYPVIQRSTRPEATHTHTSNNNNNNDNKREEERERPADPIASRRSLLLFSHSSAAPSCFIPINSIHVLVGKTKIHRHILRPSFARMTMMPPMTMSKTT